MAIKKTTPKKTVKKKTTTRRTSKPSQFRGPSEKELMEAMSKAGLPPEIIEEIKKLSAEGPEFISGKSGMRVIRMVQGPDGKVKVVPQQGSEKNPEDESHKDYIERALRGAPDEAIEEFNFMKKELRGVLSADLKRNKKMTAGQKEIITNLTNTAELLMIRGVLADAAREKTEKENKFFRELAIAVVRTVFNDGPGEEGKTLEDVRESLDNMQKQLRHWAKENGVEV